MTLGPGSRLGRYEAQSRRCSGLKLSADAKVPWSLHVTRHWRLA